MRKISGNMPYLSSLCKKAALFLLCQLAFAYPAFCESAYPDFMRSMGKMYVVVAVIVLMFLGIIIFLIFLERKLTKLENQTLNNGEEQSTS